MGPCRFEDPTWNDSEGSDWSPCLLDMVLDPLRDLHHSAARRRTFLRSLTLQQSWELGRAQVGHCRAETTIELAGAASPNLAESARLGSELSPTASKIASEIGAARAAPIIVSSLIGSSSGQASEASKTLKW